MFPGVRSLNLLLLMAMEMGLTSFNKELKDFEIADEDKIFHSAKATINDKGLLVVTSDSVSAPVAARYCWITGV